MDYGRLYTTDPQGAAAPMYATYSSPNDYIPSRSVSYGPPRIVGQCSDPFLNQRLVFVPSSTRLQRLYTSPVGGYDFDEEGEDLDYLSAYLPPSSSPVPASTRTVSKRVDSYLDDILNSPEMSEIDSETRRIKRDAQAVLARLGETNRRKPLTLSSSYFPDLAYTSTASSGSGTGSYLTRTNSYKSTGSGFSSARRATTPEVDTSLTTSRRYSSIGSSRYHQDPIAKVQSEINRKAIYSADCRKINDAARATRFRKIGGNEADDVKNRINFRAQYASLRATAASGRASSKN